MSGATFILVALIMGLGAVGLLLWALSSGQYEDPDGDAARILLDDPEDVPDTRRY